MKLLCPIIRGVSEKVSDVDIIAFKCILWDFQENQNTIRRFLPKWGKLNHFFIFRCKRHPLRVFGPLGTIGILFGILLMGLSRSNVIAGTSTLFITSGTLTFCFGLFGELVSFGHAKAVKDYRVKTF